MTKIKDIYLFSIFFIITNMVMADVSVNKLIDLKNEKSKQAFIKLEFYESIKYADEALKSSEKLAYSKGITIASLYLAKAFLELGDYKKALYYINKAEQESFFSEYINMQVESYRLKGRIYGMLDMNVKAEDEFKKQLFNSSKIKDEKQKNMSVFWSYQNLNFIYVKTKQVDSLDKYLNLQLLSQNKLDESNNFYGISDTYGLIADNFLAQDKYEEARIYIDKSFQILKKYNSRYLFKVYHRYGDYEKAIGDEEEALKYYKLALLNALKLKDMDAAKIYYKVISDFLIDIKKDINAGKEYLMTYNKINDSLNKINSNILDDVYLNIIKEQRLLKKKENNNYKYIVFGLGLVSSLALVHIEKKRRKYKKKIKIQTTETKNKSETINQLEEQLKDSRFKDMMVLAQKNSPDFIILFEELYPDVVKKIKSINPDASTSEISFLALSYLNFSTKQISQILNVTVRAIQVRKNRLRKKYNIPSDVDFNFWYKQLAIV
ncbi:tetratricopeptide repeat protein [Seonamhaeicola sp. NFXS20]|uniref:tetratricopeptide repeat protein n=1 Tax=Seonamhaeicola sp. NFXS20 TaxID=2816959 RepID=UPI003B8E4B08